jgi:hypothetical protein
MISMFAGGLAVGSTVLSILVIRGLHTGIWFTDDLVKTVAILLAIILGIVAAAFTIQFEQAKTS